MWSWHTSHSFCPCRHCQNGFLPVLPQVVQASRCWLCRWLCLRLCGWLIRSCLCSLICPHCSPLQICEKTFIPTSVELAHFALILPKSPLPERLLARHALMLAMHLIFPRLLVCVIHGLLAPPFGLDSSVVGFNPIAHFSVLSDGLLDADTVPLMLFVKTPRVREWNIQWLRWWSIEAIWSHHHASILQE